jgi:hypothetical protein
MDTKIRSSCLSNLKKQHSESLDAPSWLWSSVVALIAEVPPSAGEYTLGKPNN